MKMTTPLLVALMALTAPALQSAPPRVMTWFESLKGIESEELHTPVAVAAGPEGKIAVADASPPRLLLFRRVGVSWHYERSAPLPSIPLDLGFTRDRWVVSLRQTAELITVDDQDLTIRRIALPGEIVPGALSVLSNGGILLHDAAGERVLEIDTRGTIQRDVEVNGIVTAIATDFGGGFFAAIPDQELILHFNSQWDQVSDWQMPSLGPKPAWPNGMVVRPSGEVLVLDRHNGVILVVDLAGELVGQGSRQGWEPGLLRFPSDIALVSSREVVVADQGNGRAQVFRLTGSVSEP